jgi:septal ring factor EnvC (AmiA/AmiB activator)
VKGIFNFVKKFAVCSSLVSFTPFSHHVFLYLQMNSQEKFFNDQIENIRKAMEEKESEIEKLRQEESAEFEKLLQEQRSEFEKLLQVERAKARQCDVDAGTTENRMLRWVTGTQSDEFVSFHDMRYD